MNDPVHCLEVPDKGVFIGVREGKIYAFRDDGTGGYHAYPITGNEVCAKFHAVSPRIAGLLGTDVKRLSRLHE
ncbi:hypothetical protein [Paludisphaera mucosa]|uniref:Uncharacterized protein n=1 Tax=Paludisphaera mucosa TaxID=3030827 RepID=A0ABT6FFT6_9BACT|nr:hypothetical protein [Paludisphaera mucosa]MDG3006364.1 hypothetical protein [Paludisphaera mucosa]